MDIPKYIRQWIDDGDGIILTIYTNEEWKWEKDTFDYFANNF